MVIEFMLNFFSNALPRKNVLHYLKNIFLYLTIHKIKLNAKTTLNRYKYLDLKYIIVTPVQL